ncbi:hypothetical protein DFH06DRAFT_1297625 [Mycena polygramma]|nr:hypothetical protein DFH06DRAFT_1297625 [Mycena polygramma]
MHHALHMSNLNRLPPSMRRAANLACSPNCSPADVQRVRAYFATTTAQEIYALPVFYLHLDPAGIPTSDDDIETHSPATLATIDRAMISFQAIYMTEFPSAIGVDLWPRIWPWPYEPSDGFFGVRKLLPYGSDNRLSSASTVMSTGRMSHIRSLGVVKSPYGAHIKKAIRWLVWLLRKPSIDGSSCDHHAHKIYLGLLVLSGYNMAIAFGALHNFIKKPEVADPDNLSDIIAGAGGTLQDLSRLVIGIMNLILPVSTVATDAKNARLLAGVIQFIRHLEPLLGSGEGADHPLGPLGAALASQDIVPALTRAACASSNLAAELLSKIFFMLGTFLINTAGYDGVRQALENNLLRALIICAPTPAARALRPCLQFLLTYVLPQFFIYHGVVAALGPALNEVADLVATDTFRQSQIYPDWEKTMAVAFERLDILKRQNSGETPSMKACDSLECLVIQTKSSLKRCSGCLSFYYCSSRCQKVDWGTGGHREACSSYGTLCLSEASDADLTTRDRAFIRAVMQHDYQKSKPLTLPNELSFRHMLPDEEYLLLYNYTEGAVKITPQMLSGKSTQERLNGVEWTDLVSRAARSGGRIRLHAMVLPGVIDPRYWAICLRTDSSRVDEALRQIASELPKDRQQWDTEELTTALSSLISDSHNILEIH